jgi:hypothetical protein
MHKPLLIVALAIAFPMAASSVHAQQINPKPDPAKAREMLSETRRAKEKLSEQASILVSKIGDLSKSGKLTINDESVALLKKYVDELGEVKDSLKKLDQDIAAIQAYIEGTKKTIPKLEADVKDLQRVKFSGYTQFQFRDSDEQGRNQASFEVRRSRFNLAVTVDPRSQIRASFELAGGTNRNTPITKDAYLMYELRPASDRGGVFALAGQQPLQLGSNLPRSDADQDFPERTVYNQRLFPGERGRGVSLRAGLGGSATAHAGLFNSLTPEDPEQTNLRPGPHGGLAGVAGVRYNKGALDAGLSGMVGKRPRFTSGAGGPANTSPEVDRQFLFGDVTYAGLLVPNLTLRAEGMVGRDRVGNATGSPGNGAHPMFGWLSQLSYSFNWRNGLHLRMEQFDPNTSADGNALTGYSLGYSYLLNPRAKIMLAQERFFDGLRNPDHYDVTTLRVQFRF